MEELTHSADQLRKEFSMDSEHIAKYLQSDNFAKKVGLNISSGGDPGDVLRKKALRFFINDGFLKDAKIQAESLLKIE